MLRAVIWLQRKSEIYCAKCGGKSESILARELADEIELTEPEEEE
jgi:hypothetical protein